MSGTDLEPTCRYLLGIPWGSPTMPMREKKEVFFRTIEDLLDRIKEQVSSAESKAIRCLPRTKCAANVVFLALDLHRRNQRLETACSVQSVRGRRALQLISPCGTELLGGISLRVS
eukprot:3940624-Rhodomonas_salina.3